MQHDRLDPFTILGALGLTTATRATPVPGGADTALWRIDDRDRVYALRVLRPDQSGQFHRELAGMTAARAGGVSVPAMHRTGTWAGHPVMVLDWCPGQTLAATMQRSPDHAHALGVSFGRTLAHIHTVPAPADLDGSPTSWIDWANSDDALRARLMTLARRHPVLLHLDYHPLNVLIEGDEVSAVLDWANARAGDPRADLARTLSILYHAPVETFPRRALIAGCRAGYAQVAGRRRQMAAFYAWAGAVMVHDLAPRLGRSDLPWLTPAYLDGVRSWTARWRIRAGLPPSPAVTAAITRRPTQPDRQ